VNLSSKIVVVVSVIVTIVVIISAYTFFFGAFAPLEQRQDKTLNIATQNVEIQATTFNGDIIIETSTSNQIEVTYDVQAPQGHLNEITTSTTNQTINGNTRIVAETKIENNGVKVNFRSTITLKLPSSSQYNLTLNTLNGNIVKPLLNDTNVAATTENGYIDIKDDNANSIVASNQNGNVNIKLVKNTLFQVDANTANGHVTYQGIAMNTSIQTTTHLKGNTTNGLGHLDLTLSSANGNVTIEYLTQ
jgi:DUF4097 and DUF4098 domain-containing protein YvlB